MGGKSYKGGVRLNRRTMTDLVTEWFRENQERTVSVKKLYEELKLKTHPMRSMCLDIVLDLVEDGFLKEKDGQFQLMQKSKFLEGVLQRRVGGRNYLVPDDGSDPVSVAERNTSGALNGDRGLPEGGGGRPARADGHRGKRKGAAARAAGGGCGG